MYSGIRVSLAPGTGGRAASGYCFSDWLAASGLCLVALGPCQPWAVGMRTPWSLQALTRDSVLSLGASETAPEQMSVLEAL